MSPFETYPNISLLDKLTWNVFVFVVDGTQKGV